MREWLSRKLLYLAIVVAPTRTALAIQAGINQHCKEQISRARLVEQRICPKHGQHWHWVKCPTCFPPKLCGRCDGNGGYCDDAEEQAWIKCSDCDGSGVDHSSLKDGVSTDG